MNGAKIYDAPESKSADSVPRLSREFDIEGELEINFSGSQPLFIIDGCHLSEFVARHFRKSRYDTDRSFGKVKILIIPLAE